MKKKRITTILLGIALAGGLGTWAAISWWQSQTEWPFRRMLPRNAQDVHEWSHEDTLLPDYSYLLKAQISREEFGAYVAYFRLTPHTSARVYTDSDIWFEWGPGDDWWNPSDEKDGAFVRQEGDGWTYAKYEQGYLYLKSLDH